MRLRIALYVLVSRLTPTSAGTAISPNGVVIIPSPNVRNERPATRGAAGAYTAGVPRVSDTLDFVRILFSGVVSRQDAKIAKYRTDFSYGLLGALCAFERDLLSGITTLILFIRSIPLRLPLFFCIRTTAVSLGPLRAVVLHRLVLPVYRLCFQ